ncbi:MAG: exodeoxyribonuclease III [Bacilli bacterium]|jgi:exodeoxyribonuclease III
MKFISFNVNGVRAILKKDFTRDFESLNADIFAIQETKYTEDLHLDFPFAPKGYFTYWTNSDVKKGYSGVAVFTKKEPLAITYGLENNKYDDEGRVITLEFKNFYFVACYVPNSGEGLVRLGFRMTFEEDLEKYLTDLDSKKPVIYCGDLNVAHEEIDIKNPDSNHQNAGFTDDERAKMTKLLSLGFTDSFRYLHKDEVKYSWWSYRFSARSRNAGWRIDYFLVSNRIASKIEKAEIHNEIQGSDHCPIELDINMEE